jgi:hypothetical protein
MNFTPMKPMTSILICPIMFSEAFLAMLLAAIYVSIIELILATEFTDGVRGGLLAAIYLLTNPHSALLQFRFLEIVTSENVHWNPKELPTRHAFYWGF